MFGLGVPELVVIVLFFLLFMFGSSRIGDFARTLGRFSGEFQKGRLEIEKELQKAREEFSQGVKEADAPEKKRRIGA